VIRACRLSRNYFVGALSARNDDFEVRMLSDFAGWNIFLPLDLLPPCYGARETWAKTAGFSFMRDFAGLLLASDSMCRLRFFRPEATRAATLSNWCGQSL
jgi:hypothetical protein